MSRFLEEIERLLKSPTTSPESRERLRRAREKSLAVYAIGERVRVKGVDVPLTVVERTVYGPTAQFYGLVHEDAAWMPPKGVSVNTNFDRPRVVAALAEVSGEA